MTIELGFAELTIDETHFGIVDVPGHERFVRTMVAGATGIDIALLVVAADDSVMPQTIEHVEILRLLGLERAVVAITKIDVVDETMVELVTDDVRELLAGSPLANAPICPVSSTKGTGIAELRRALVAVAAQIEKKSPATPFRMAVDRVFTVQGRGTVVTGSVLCGQVQNGDTLDVFPGMHRCRVRDLQAHGSAHASIARGQRAAINVSGIDRQQLQRGSELATPGYLQPARILDVQLHCLGSLNRPLKSTSTVRLELGTTELPVRVVLLESDRLEPGDTAFAQLRSGEPITCVYGQRFILRDESATRTIGGGVVLRPSTQRRRRIGDDTIEALTALATGNPVDRLAQVLTTAAFDPPTDLQMCARSGVELGELTDLMTRLKSDGTWAPVATTGHFATPQTVEHMTRRLVSWLERHHRAHPQLPGRPVDSVLGWLERVTTHRALARPLLDQMIASKIVKPLGRFICSPAFAPELSAADEKLLSVLVSEVREGGFQPPTLDGVSIATQAGRKRITRLATLAVAMGELVAIEGRMYLHADAEHSLRKTVADLISASGGVTVAQVREALDSSRKFVVPFLEYLDRIGFTQRTGDERTLVQDDDA